MSSASRWATVIEAIEPEYQKLKQMIDDGPIIACALSKRTLRHWIRIHEDWSNTPADQHYAYYTASTGKVDERINWAIEQLKDWPLVSRQSYDQWAFVRKRDAEKFKTLYHLVWGQ